MKLLATAAVFVALGGYAGAANAGWRQGDTGRFNPPPRTAPMKSMEHKENMKPMKAKHKHAKHQKAVQATQSEVPTTLVEQPVTRKQTRVPFQTPRSFW